MRLLTLKLTKRLLKESSLKGADLLIEIMLRWVNLLSFENVFDYLKKSIEDAQTKLYVYRTLPTLQQLEAFPDPRIRQELLSLILEFIIAHGFDFAEQNDAQNLMQVEEMSLGSVETSSDVEVFLAKSLAALSIEQARDYFSESIITWSKAINLDAVKEKAIELKRYDPRWDEKQLRNFVFFYLYILLVDSLMIQEFTNEFLEKWRK